MHFCQLCFCRVRNFEWETMKHMIALLCTVIQYSPNVIIVICIGDLLVLRRVGGQLHVFHGERRNQECCHLLASPVP